MVVPVAIVFPLKTLDTHERRGNRVKVGGAKASTSFFKKSSKKRLVHPPLPTIHTA
jgi:hypothetical protein